MIKVLCDAKGCTSEEVMADHPHLGGPPLPTGWMHVHFMREVSAADYDAALRAQGLSPDFAIRSQELGDDVMVERVEASLCPKHPFPELRPEAIQKPGLGLIVAGRRPRRLRPVS